VRIKLYFAVNLSN